MNSTITSTPVALPPGAELAAEPMETAPVIRLYQPDATALDAVVDLLYELLAVPPVNGCISSGLAAELPCVPAPPEPSMS